MEIMLKADIKQTRIVYFHDLFEVYIYKYGNSSLDLERNTENVVSGRKKVRVTLA